MNIFGIGLPEMAVIAAIALLVFGPKRLPEMGKTLGKTLKGFQSASQEFEKEFRQAIDPEATASATSTATAPAVAEAPISVLPPGPDTAVTATAVAATPLGASVEAD
ncbi:MAG: TatA/E family twin arginine-targeting protein translocase [Cyanobacteriota bacterium]|jgi:sec-independent protein translocase protein TatA